MPTQFVHLHVHSGYSLSEGIPHIDELVGAVHRLNMPAAALTDVGNIFGAIKFYRACLRRGIKPIIGADVGLMNPDMPKSPHRLVLLCRNNEGYQSLCRLLTRSHTVTTASVGPCINAEWLRAESSGLIALSCAENGDLARALLAQKTEQAKRLADTYRELFIDGFYVELTRNGRPEEEGYVNVAVEFAAQYGLPTVATNQVQFVNPNDYEAHEVRVCINEGRVLADTRRQRRFTDQQYLRSPDEMSQLFQDIPEAVLNTVEIAKRCNVVFQFDRSYLPEFPVVGRPGDTNELLRSEAHQGLRERLNVECPRAANEQTYEDRLRTELDVITNMGFAGYFLIVADFIRWAKTNGIPVGPGRGSGAGSLVAFCLSITELDPIQHGLLFERFLNPERVSLPDFDIDFCMQGRDRVIDYVADKYGRDKVAQIITHGTMAARAVVRDVGRVMNLPYGYVDTIAKLIPFEVGMTLERALEQEELLRARYDTDEDVRQLIETAKALEGLPRNVGKHAGGVVIAPSTLTDFTPLYSEGESKQAVTQFDKDDLEAIGLVKFDFLGLKTLTIIDKTLKFVNDKRTRRAEPALALQNLPTDDPKTYALIKAGRATGIFQLESRGMRELIQGLRPDRFEDLIALVALYRPGPLQSGMVEDFINRKHGREHIRYPHPTLEPILQPTYGVILYQEQVMEIAQVMAGYSLGSADLLRRAMGKKKPEEMARQRQVFLDGAHRQNVDLVTASHIFDLMEKFAGYGFNKSHSAAYALITFQTAWLKANHCAAFMAACLSADMENTDKVVSLIAECRELGIEILPPDINRCGHEFIPITENQILYGLGAIKGIGTAAIDCVLAAREGTSGFDDLFDFCRRIDVKRVNRRVIESLIKAGAMDSLASDRAMLMSNLPVAVNVADQEALHATQSDLFGVANVAVDIETQTQIQPWSNEERLRAEKESLGLYLTGHPIERYRRELEQLGCGSFGDLNISGARNIVVVGLIVGLRTLNTRRGERMAFLTLDDHTGRIDVSVFSDLYAASRDVIRKDNLVAALGQISTDEYTGGYQMRADKVFNLETLRERFVDCISINIEYQTCNTALLWQLEKALSAYRGGRCALVIHYVNETGDQADIRAGSDWLIHPTPNAIDALTAIIGEDNLTLHYSLRDIQAEALNSTSNGGSFSSMSSPVAASG